MRRAVFRSTTRWAGLAPLASVMFALLLGAACGNSDAANAGAQQRAADYQVSIGGRVVTLRGADWRAMQNEATFARNFEATSNPTNRKYQIQHLHDPDERGPARGQQLSPTEYLEVFVVGDGEVVVQVRRDHGAYWVLSRETFTANAVPGVALAAHRELAANELRRITYARRLQIDTTRHLLVERLRAS